MNSRLQAIENSLASINETVFQELCDSFLILKNENYRAFSRIGSQSGKQKTIKGTPDTFFLLPNGKYVFVEYSTNISKGVSKLQEDIEKCLNTTKTKILINQIAEIILCINFNLNTEEIQSLRSLLGKAKLTLTIYTLDSLSLELHLQHRDLVHKYLGLPLDTGQIVSISTFVDEYNKASKGIATPLDNTFLHRDEELENIKQQIKQSDFLIITGVAGVGKTKIAIEAINSFLAENLSYDAFCVSYKNCELLSDLYQHFDDKKDYILFVDDANRIDAFSQITGFYKSQRTGNLKILLTARDYALPIVESFCFGFVPAQFNLKKFTDEQITDIIKAEPFNISNWQFHKEIVRIADGNPRLAIMTALLAKQEQNIYALADVSDLFEKYFSTFVNDDGEFSNQFNIKCLGIIAFFNAIPYKDKNITEPILQNFGVDYSLFIDAIEKLDRLELVEIRYDYVKIPEQNLATFFFYKTFVKDNLLSFEILLIKYFNENKNRFKDCVIPANNTFGYENVMQKLKPILQNYLKSIENDEERIFAFLETFWFYLQEETLLFVYNGINQLPLLHNIIYEVKYETNDFTYEQNKVIELISNFFRFQNKLKDAIELIFEFVRKKPERLPELIHNIREVLVFDCTDEGYGFERQNILFRILIDGLNKQDILYSTIFYELSKTFLAFKYRQTESGRHNTISLYQYPIPDNKWIRTFRKNIWENVNDNFKTFPEKSLELLQSYAKVSPDVTKELMEYDIQFLIPIIENHLIPDIFEHCLYVQEQIRWCKRNEITPFEFVSLSQKFTNPTYEMYLILDWDSYRDKNSYDFDNYREYEKLKEVEVRKYFVFNDIQEIKSFYDTFIHLKSIAENDWSYNNSFDLIIDENCSKNFELGCQFLSEVIATNNQISYIPRIVFRNQLITQEKSQYIWNIIQSNDFENRYSWELSFYDNLADSLINEKYIEQIKNTVKKLPDRTSIWFGGLKRYLAVEPNLFQELLQIIIDKHEKQDKIVFVQFNIIEDHFDELGNDIDLIKKLYLQQDLIDNHFDLTRKGFAKIIQRDENFLIEYINQHCLHEDRYLNVIWESANIEPILKTVFDSIDKKDMYFGSRGHFCNSFFWNLPQEANRRAKNFLLDYCRENYESYKKTNLIVDIARHSMRELFEDVLLLFISLTQNVDLFSKIWWIGNGGMYSGDVIIGDVKAAEWRKILSIVEKYDIGIKLLPIKQYINQEVESSLNYADWERKRKFIEND
ncbi:MAG: ATP-binding protein [Bacteroidales bacterium]|jgi:hypothetical protein|nr:ATP-binding protein [Bacteroidales bacterium]